MPAGSRPDVPGNWNSGRRPHPTAVRILRGNPSKTPIRPDEPKPAAATPDFDTPPEELLDDPLALREWARVVPMLRVCGVISNAERSALIALCTEWSRWLEAQQNVRKLGMLIKGHHGPMQNPFIKIARNSLNQCQRLWTELGLTPASRAKLTALPVPEIHAPRLSKWGNDL